VKFIAYAMENNNVYSPQEQKDKRYKHKKKIKQIALERDYASWASIREPKTVKCHVLRIAGNVTYSMHKNKFVSMQFVIEDRVSQKANITRLDRSKGSS
jgi:hypothetical protein